MQCSTMLDSCESRLNIHLSCAGLRNMDIIGRSDPFAILFLDPTGASVAQRRADYSNSMLPNLPDALPSPAVRSVKRGRYPGRDGRWERVGTTETVPNSLNVSFAASFEIKYFFERAQKLAVDVFDRDVVSERDDDIHRHDYLGSAEVSVPALVRAPGQKLTVPLSLPDYPAKKCGTLTIVAEEVTEAKQRINYDVSLTGISKSLTFNKGKGPYLTVSRRSAGLANNQPWITVLRTSKPATVVGHGAFDLHRLTYNYEKFCRCDDNTQLRFDISFERAGTHRVVASALSSLRECDGRGGIIYLSAKDRGCFPSPRAGILRLKNRRLTEDITFLDYLIGGCEISLVIAIDFTASNGDPKQRGTLHFWDSMDINEYEMAIRAVGDILAAYNSEQLFPAYGFGAKRPPDFQQPSHRFPLTNTNDPTCHTIEEVLNCYRHTLYNVRLSGPTVFAEIIRAGAEHARMGLREYAQSYTILLIITDGVINDVETTLNEITSASSLPLSIVIIGVGDADFSDMVFLDGDDEGRERDIVQFVNFRQYKDTPEVLRSMVLEEIPDQLVQYMTMKGIYPQPRPAD